MNFCFENVDPRAPDLAPALRNGQTLWTFPLQKAQWASNASNDTDLCYLDTASLEKRIEKVSIDAMSVDRLPGLVHSIHQSDQSFSGNTSRSGCLLATSMQQLDQS